MAAQTVAEVGCAGACAVVLSMLGVSPGVLMLAVMGCGAGVLATPDRPRLQAILAFALCSPAGALVGSVLTSEGGVQRLVAFATSAVAVPILMGLRDAVANRSTDFWGKVFDRILGGRQ